ncbi:hypothetical protein J437_LFUL019156 [Ladona fulva]|uniref:Uncharacterized protein n=1 Tax=Ladona fulva TaxID=123851 RepID=A0A8K0PCF2_LADFU|nr:hypothetical protein J437_LFUL019156 [Ladona fulva]
MWQWSDNDVSPETLHPLILCTMLLVQRVISITSSLTLFLKVGCGPLLSNCNSVVIRYSKRDSLLGLTSELPHTEWCELESHPTRRSQLLVLQNFTRSSSSLLGRGSGASYGTQTITFRFTSWSASTTLKMVPARGPTFSTTPGVSCKPPRSSLSSREDVGLRHTLKVGLRGPFANPSEVFKNPVSILVPRVAREIRVGHPSEESILSTCQPGLDPSCIAKPGTPRGGCGSAPRMVVLTGIRQQIAAQRPHPRITYPSPPISIFTDEAVPSTFAFSTRADSKFTDLFSDSKSVGENLKSESDTPSERIIIGGETKAIPPKPDSKLSPEILQKYEGKTREVGRTLSFKSMPLLVCSEQLGRQYCCLCPPLFRTCVTKRDGIITMLYDKVLFETEKISCGGPQIDCAYGDSALSYSQVWRKAFKEGREEVVNKPHAGGPSTNSNLTCVHDLLNSDRG